MQTKTKTAKNNLPLNVVQPNASSSGCCSTTDDGAAICIVPENGTPSSCACSSTSEAKKAETSETSETAEPHIPPKQTTLPGKIRSGVLFGVACLASPCCTPLYVPLLLLLLAGTPAAVWMSANIGWVYGALTLISIVSFVLAVRYWPQAKAKRQIGSKHSKQLSTETK